MRLRLTIKNYRCFPEECPATFEIGPGFTSFVGANNSGKSSLLRFFYEARRLLGTISSAAGLVAGFKGEYRLFADHTPLPAPERFFSASSGSPFELRLLVLDPPPTKYSQILPPARGITIAVDQKTQLATYSLVLDENPNYVPQMPGKFTIQDGRVSDFGTDKADVTPLFLAGQALTNTLYLGPFRNLLGISSKAEYYDICIGRQFIKMWRDMKAGHNSFENEAALALTEDLRRLFGFNHLEINATPTGDGLKVFVDRKSFHLEELGAGFAHFLLALTHAAQRRPAFVLIDEPELNLHPAYQTLFLTTLGAYATVGTVFSTHSIGLARSISQSVYSLQRQRQEVSSIRLFDANPRLPEFLGELGYLGYRELGVRKILLVEGVSDVPTYQQFLRCLGAEGDVLLLNLGGSGYVNGKADTGHQLAELRRVASSLYAVIDSERKNEGDPLSRERQQFVKLCRRLDITCHVLERRATENYLSDSAVKAVKGAEFRALGHFEALSECDPHWGKAENWRIARTMRSDEVRQSDVGRFLRDVVLAAPSEAVGAAARPNARASDEAS